MFFACQGLRRALRGAEEECELFMFIWGFAILLQHQAFQLRGKYAARGTILAFSLRANPDHQDRHSPSV